MDSSSEDESIRITPSMSILDVIVQCGKTEGVFHDYGEKIGVCLCCEALFDSLDHVAKTYRLDLDALLSDLKAASGA